MTQIEIPMLVIITFIIFILAITIGLIWYIRAYKSRQRARGFHKVDDLPPVKEQAMEKPVKARLKTALILKDKHGEHLVELLGGVTLPIDYDANFVPPDKVYIKYYDDYEPMLVLMYRHGVGYVLVSETREAEPKFYPPHKVFVGQPVTDYVQGYLDTEDVEQDAVFIVTSRVVTNDSD